MSKKNHLAAANPKVFVEPYRVDGTKPFHLTSYKTADRGAIDKDPRKKIRRAHRYSRRDWQDRWDAHDAWPTLLDWHGL